MKKLLCLLLTLAMTLSLAACGSKADDKTPEEDNPTQAETNIADKPVSYTHLTLPTKA